MFDSARILFPAITLWKSETFLSNVMVAPSVSVVSVPLIEAIAGEVKVLLVSVSDELTVGIFTPLAFTIPEPFVVRSKETLVSNQRLYLYIITCC